MRKREKIKLHVVRTLYHEYLPILEIHAVILRYTKTFWHWCKNAAYLAFSSFTPTEIRALSQGYHKCPPNAKESICKASFFFPWRKVLMHVIYTKLPILHTVIVLIFFFISISTLTFQHCIICASLWHLQDNFLTIKKPQDHNLKSLLPQFLQTPKDCNVSNSDDVKCAEIIKIVLGFILGFQKPRGHHKVHPWS